MSALPPRRRPTYPAIAVLGMLATTGAVASSTARADELRTVRGRGGGAYGRLDHDFMLAIGGGASHWDGAPRTDEGGFAWSASVRFRYLDSVGPGAAVHHADGATYVFVFGEVRPLFPALFLMNVFTGLEVFDLLVQSLGFELGGVVTTGSGIESGVLLGLGLGVDVPIVPPSVLGDGIYLHAHARHVLGAASDRFGVERDIAAWLLGAELTVKLGLFEGLSGWEPRR